MIVYYHKMFNIIVAIEKNGGIAKDGKLPWPHNKEDMRQFVRITTGEPPKGKQNAMIMGRKTWESIDNRYLPLRNRINIVLSRKSIIMKPDVLTYNSFDMALQSLIINPGVHEIFVIGGQEVYEIAIQDPRCRKLYISEIPGIYKCDKFFPEIPKWFELKKTVTSLTSKTNPEFRYYETIFDVKSSENQYLDTLHNILQNGKSINDRTGVGTFATFSEHMTFPIEVVNPNAEQIELKYRVPIMTTKTLFHRGVFEELIFFLQGKTHIGELQEKGVRIWDGNTSREFLDKHDLETYDEGETGPFYGFQWNYFGAKYQSWQEGCYKSYEHAVKTGEAVNQLEECIRLLKTDPYSRRIVLSAWNPVDLPNMCLPPCHMVYNFCVMPPSQDQTKPRLYCAMFQRSGDMFLGVPFNIYSTALLTIFMSRAANMLPGGISLNITNAHIYKNHIKQAQTQLKRSPYRYPILQITKNIDTLQDMRDLDFKEHYELTEYHRHPAIKANMAV